MEDLAAAVDARVQFADDGEVKLAANDPSVLFWLQSLLLTNEQMSGAVCERSCTLTIKDSTKTARDILSALGRVLVLAEELMPVPPAEASFDSPSPGWVPPLVPPVCPISPGVATVTACETCGAKCAFLSSSGKQVPLHVAVLSYRRLLQRYPSVPDDGARAFLEEDLEDIPSGCENKHNTAFTVEPDYATYCACAADMIALC